jgi:hypothetical protein
MYHRELRTNAATVATTMLDAMLPDIFSSPCVVAEVIEWSKLRHGSRHKCAKRFWEFREVTYVILIDGNAASRAVWEGCRRSSATPGWRPMRHGRPRR